METLLIHPKCNQWWEVLENLSRNGDVVLHVTNDVKEAYITKLKELNRFDDVVSSISRCS